MELTGEYRIPAPRQAVWEALNDADMLKVCIDGCEELVWVGDTELAAKVRAKVGPVSARFAGKLELTELDPPRSYVIVGQGQGGTAGFAKGSARVELEELDDGAETLLRYSVDAQVGGKLASVGSRLISGVAGKVAEDFFERLTARLSVIRSAEAQRAELDEVEEWTSSGPVEMPPELLAGHEPAEATGDGADAPGRIRLGAQPIILVGGWGFMALVLILLFAL